MINQVLKDLLSKNISEKISDGTYKKERIIKSPQDIEIKVDGFVKPLLNFCSNNYLGLANHPKIKEAAKSACDTHGFGMSSVRFICGTQDLHKNLENKISNFLQTEDTILYNSCFDANGGLFQNLLSSEDVIISASLNHASIIDGVRLCTAKRMIFNFDNMSELDNRLSEAKDCRVKMVVTDGVFSMEGELAKLDKISALCKKHNAMLVVDDSHATGFIGDNGRGTPEYFKVESDVDLYTGTLGKALGGATGGYISGNKDLIDWFRNTSRPYLFSNSLAPTVVAGAIESINIIKSDEGRKLRIKSKDNTHYFRESMKQNGFNIKDGIHPIVPIMLGDAKIATNMADDLLEERIYVIGFSYPVVPKNTARIRVQISAIHTKEQLDYAIESFVKLGKKYKVI
ncbi:MAG: glycine C-acetyltransferase [Spirochaetota bacterium]|nr:glycine C-acetyltransferase [Spirochaetota bacterium]